MALGRIGKDKRGLSLVELIVAIALMGIGFLGVVTMFPLANRTVAESGMQSVATELAQRGLESLLNLQYNDAKLSTSDSHTDTETVGARTYYITWTVQKDVPVTGCKTIVYTVAWDEDDENKEISVTGVVASTGRL